jgi:mono/diheme cytochrome c family protein
MRRNLLPALTCSLLATAWGLAPVRAAAPSVDYSRDVKPILAAHCYACHGPDEGRRKGKLRLDLRTEAIKKAIKPGQPSASPVIARITSTEPEEIMPPPGGKRHPLTAGQIDTLRRWIDQGAKFDIHWAYVKPARPAVPAIPNTAWARNPIDHFIAARHQQAGYRPAPEADRVTLLRRLSFDLTGLPPTPQDVQAFVSDTSPEAYEKVVNRLLASEHLGERLAGYWLDLVRFADTCGYHSDNHRDLALYRDWVINAFNTNKRFDRFTIEQLAGDLLPAPSVEQKIASGYNRLLQTTEEGGAQAKEYVAKYAADRVRNVSSVWLGATMGCAECHNHKFDPITMRDFYSLGAFFADVQEAAVGRQPQTALPTPEQQKQLAQLNHQIAELKTDLETAQARATDPAKRTPRQKELLARRSGPLPDVASLKAQLSKREAEKKELEKSIPQTLVTMAGGPRMMRILPRGNWLDDSGEVVGPAVPGFLPPLTVNNRRPNRLDLANWLVSPDNPLTARVFVNRLWKITFGQGIVRSLEDFGTQGTLPSHPELLDWLGVEFQASGWDVKHLLKLMVMSSTYRQSSLADRESRERDPANTWLARQNRFRLDAEMVRDNALAVSGLLVRKIGGPSVKPYQPAGYWEHLNFPRRTYQHDHGPDQYRRGLYTYWQRTFLHPSLKAFDAPSREECTVERPRSSTPLQALVLLNDPTYVEAARVLAERIIREGGRSVPERLDWAYRQVLSRGVRPAEVGVLEGLYRKHRDEYVRDAQAADKLIHVGERPVPKDLDRVELAAWTSVARVLLNLHETITRN